MEGQRYTLPIYIYIYLFIPFELILCCGRRFKMAGPTAECSIVHERFAKWHESVKQRKTVKEARDMRPTPFTLDSTAFVALKILFWKWNLRLRSMEHGAQASQPPGKAKAIQNNLVLQASIQWSTHNIRLQQHFPAVAREAGASIWARLTFLGTGQNKYRFQKKTCCPRGGKRFNLSIVRGRGRHRISSHLMPGTRMACI